MKHGKQWGSSSSIKKRKKKRLSHDLAISLLGICQMILCSPIEIPALLKRTYNYHSGYSIKQIPNVLLLNP